MPDYDNRNRGVLFKNDRKQSDSHPDYTGSITLESGAEHFLDAWLNTYRKPDGTEHKYLSVKIGSLKEQRSEAPRQPEAASAAAEFDDEIPF